MILGSFELLTYRARLRGGVFGISSRREIRVKTKKNVLFRIQYRVSTNITYVLEMYL